MSEGLVSRVKRLVSGSVNSIVDTIENAAPETVMREAIREVERAIDDVRAELGLAAANRHHANKRLMETASKHDALADHIETAVAEGRDDLAEAAIGRQLDRRPRSRFWRPRWPKRPSVNRNLKAISSRFKGAAARCCRILKHSCRRVLTRPRRALPLAARQADRAAPRHAPTRPKGLSTASFTARQAYRGR